ncbi:TetR/AcrR family transcriptional regulator [Thalassolituus sp. LLYu03]|uniref:TetR/AcrR family transcriptional regulator n=1 Tax=Thalassolituus sp. LLYu03 TaxID=3421656 RepID=UPI003D2A5AC2
MALVAETAINKGKPLQYQGRKASRAKSEQRRRVILEAALRIVVNEGVRGIRHRAVAKEAGVPLAATTYYFKDIQELIVDTFTLYTEKALEVVSEFTQQFYQPMASMAGRDITTPEGQQALTEFMVDQLTVYMKEQVVGQRDMLVAEQAFRYEAIVNTSIRKLAQMHRKALFDRAAEFFRAVAQSPAPEADAEILLGLFHSLEYRALLNNDSDEAEMAMIAGTLRRYVDVLVPSLLRNA